MRGDKEFLQKNLKGRIDKTLIGEDDIDTSNRNRDLMEVTNDLEKLLRKSQEVSDKEKTKVNYQLSSKGSS